MSILQIALTSAAISVAVPAVLRGLAASRSARGEARDGAIVLRYGSRMRATCIGLLVVPLVGLAALGLASPPSTSEDARAFVGLFLLFLLLGGPLVIEALGVEIRLSREGIARRSPWSRALFIPWEAVRRVVWSPGARWWIVEADGGGRVRLHELLSGLEDFKAWVTRYATGATTPFEDRLDPS